MSKLGQLLKSVEKHDKFVLDQVKRARTDEKFGREMTERWNKIKAEIPDFARRRPDCRCRAWRCPRSTSRARSRVIFSARIAGRISISERRLPRDVSRADCSEIETGSYGKENGQTDLRKRTGSRTAASRRKPEEPTRLFSGLMLAEDTNKRFHFLSAHQRSKRLSTAFDGPTLYGIDSRRRWRFRKNRRRRRRGRHGRRHGAALRWLRSRLAEFFRVDDDQRSGADHHGDVHRGGEASLRRRKLFRICAARFRPTFSRKSRRRTKRFSRSKRRCVFSAT